MLLVAALIGFFLTSISLFSVVNAVQGITCDGRWYCERIEGDYEDFMKNVMANPLPPTRMYKPGERIACLVKVCASLEYTMQDYNGSVVNSLVEQLHLHGCIKCGSVPVLYPGSNAVNFGVLRIDWYWSAKCKGGCKKLTFDTKPRNNP